MDKAQWSPINTERPSAAIGPAVKKQHQGLTRLPINFSNATPMRAKKHSTDSPTHVLDRHSVTKNPSLIVDLSTSRPESHSSKPRESESVGTTSPINQIDSSTPATTLSPGESTLERRVENKNHDLTSNARNPTSTQDSRAGSQTPKVDHQPATAVMTKSIRPPEPGQNQSAKEIYQAFNIPPPENDPTMSDKQAKAAKMGKPGLVVLKRTSAPKSTPTSSARDSPNLHIAKSHEDHLKPVQDPQPIEIVEQSSSSSDGDAADVPADASPTAEGAHEEAEDPIVEDVGDATTNSLPDDHPIEWLAEARTIYQHSLPPFVVKQKSGVRRMVELPLAEGHQNPEMVEVVYRPWDAEHTFCCIDKGDQRFIVKVFRGGATPYRPWLGPQTGFSETALAFAKQGPRGSRSWAAIQDNRRSLPKGWALEEDDANDDDYNPGSRPKYAQGQGRRKSQYDLNGEEEDFNENQYQPDAHELHEPLQSERSSVERDFAAPDPTVDRRAQSNISDTRPPSKLINAVKKSLRLPKGQVAYAKPSFRPKEIKRRSIGGQGATTDSKAHKRKTHKAIFSSDSENPIPHKKAKGTKVIHRSLSTNSGNLKNVSQALDYDPPHLEVQTLSPYKQAHTTLRIALVPYPQQSAVQRLRSCMTIAAFFSTVVGVSGYKGDRDRIFGITATFDCKPADDPDRNMVIRAEWQDSFDIFLETVDAAESWTEEGGKCNVSVGLLLAEG